MVTGPGNLGIAINTSHGRPEKADHTLGQNVFQGEQYRLLERTLPSADAPSSINDGDTVILLTEYPEYRDELHQLGLKHWLENPMYNGLIPRFGRTALGKVLRKCIRKILGRR